MISRDLSAKALVEQDHGQLTDETPEIVEGVGGMHLVVHDKAG
jgi:hypothetical protein